MMTLPNDDIIFLNNLCDIRILSNTGNTHLHFELGLSNVIINKLLNQATSISNNNSRNHDVLMEIIFMRLESQKLSLWKKSEKMIKNHFTPDGLTEKKNSSIGPGIVSQIQQMLMSEQFPETGSLVLLLVM